MSLILDNCIFLHTPKTGGTWVKSALENAGLIRGWLNNYHTPLEAARRDSRTWKKPMFSVVRSPFSWYSSYWKFRISSGKWDPKMDQGLERPTFKQFLRAVAVTRPGIWTEVLNHYAGRPGMKQVDRVLKQESLTEGLIKVLQEFGEEFDPEDIRSTPLERKGVPWLADQAVPDDRDEELIWEMDGPAMVRFGYV